MIDLKKILKRILKKCLKKRIYIYKDKPVFSIKQICKLLNIEIPKELESSSDLLFTKTELLNDLENKNDILDNLVLKENLKEKEYLEIKKYILKFKDKYFSQECFDKSDYKLVKMTVQWYYLFDNYGFNYNDYFDYEMYNKKIKDLDKFLNNKYRGIVYGACNNRDYTINFKNKASFNKRFEKYVHRDWIDSTTCDLVNFESFVKKHPKFFAKPVAGTGGAGAGIRKYDENLNQLYNECKKEKMICEEIVEQHKDMASFNKDTLNTCRIYTLWPLYGKPIITLAMVRFGRQGNSVDNFHSGGVSAGIDLETGKINTQAINRAHLKFEKHPDSKKEFIGFQIPCWDKLVKTVCEAAELFPEIRHVGWDVAITKDGEIEFIEGNAWPNFDITQAVDQIGKKHRYEKYINELIAAKKNLSR